MPNTDITNIIKDARGTKVALRIGIKKLFALDDSGVVPLATSTPVLLKVAVALDQLTTIVNDLIMINTTIP